MESEPGKPPKASKGHVLSHETCILQVLVKIAGYSSVEGMAGQPSATSSTTITGYKGTNPGTQVLNCHPC
jgi:hypothetical protein